MDSPDRSGDAWPADFWRMGALLLHQQCWQWGRDIESPYGNLLMAAGFERHPPPEGMKAGSRYVRRLPGSPAVCLWGFGLLAWLPDAGGIFIGRYSFVPLWVDSPEAAEACWQPDAFHGLLPPRTRKHIRAAKRLMRLILVWLAEYEESIAIRHGIGYRRETLQSWPEPAVPPERLPLEWRRLSRSIPDPPPAPSPAPV